MHSDNNNNGHGAGAAAAAYGGGARVDQQYTEHERNLAIRRQLEQIEQEFRQASGPGGGGAAAAAGGAHRSRHADGRRHAHHPYLQQQPHSAAEGQQSAPVEGGGGRPGKAKATVEDEDGFADLLKRVHGWDIVKMGGDGACLFRAVGELFVVV